jgi:hypothetical protein
LNVRIREQVLREAEPPMSLRDLVYFGHMLDVARKAVGKVGIFHATPTTQTKTFGLP